MRKFRTGIRDGYAAVVEVEEKNGGSVGEAQLYRPIFSSNLIKIIQ